MSVRNHVAMALVFIMGSSMLIPIAGCADEAKIEISLPEDNTVASGGSILVVATLSDQQRVEDGTPVTFRTTVGSFEKWSTDVTEPVYEKEVATVESKAETRLYGFPGESGGGTLSASFEAISDATVSQSVSIMVEGGTKANGRYFSASCDAFNVTVYGDNEDRLDMQFRCEIRASDILGSSISKANIHWRVEEGCAIKRIEEPGSQDLVVSLIPDCNPKDVEPMDGEPTFSKDGITHNPRDGLLTMMFYTDGEEGFIDLNGNNQYDPGESFEAYDLPEPFVDSNDNLTHDPEEEFVDSNNNGKWDQANGQWDADTKIWASAKIMFTGMPHEDVVFITPDSIDVPNAGTQSFSIYIADINHNPIASQPVGDDEGVDFSAEGAEVFSDESLYLSDSMGVEFNLDGSIKPSSFLEGRNYPVVLSDPDPDPESLPVPAILRVSIRWVSARPFSDYEPAEYEGSLGSITGTCH